MKMEKPSSSAAKSSKYKLLRLLPKAATVNFQNLPFSPSRDKTRALDHHHLKNKAFSGPIISIIPEEARNKSKNSTFGAQEPTSPKVSCMGQVKQRNKLGKSKRYASLQKHLKPTPPLLSSPEIKKKPSTFRKIFSRKSSFSSEKSRIITDDARDPVVVPGGLSEMKRFASGRERLGNFDWTKAQQIAPEDHDMNQRRCYSDDEEEDGDDYEEEEIIIPFSAPLMMVGGGGGGGASSISLEPRKEINIWKRRTMAKPRCLQL